MVCSAGQQREGDLALRSIRAARVHQVFVVTRLQDSTMLVARGTSLSSFAALRRALDNIPESPKAYGYSPVPAGSTREYQKQEAKGSCPPNRDQ